MFFTFCNLFFISLTLSSCYNLHLCGGQISPGSTRRIKDLTKRPEGPINRKVIPSWAWGRMTSEADRHKAGSVRAQTAQQRRASNHNSDPTFSRWSLVQRNQARMSRHKYRKIDSISSLFLRCALLSCPHVLPHGRIYKA
jgi:hypothetical protein